MWQGCFFTFWVDFTQKCKFSARHLFNCGPTQMPQGPTSGRFLPPVLLKPRPRFVLVSYCKRQKPRQGPAPKVRGGYFLPGLEKDKRRDCDLGLTYLNRSVPCIPANCFDLCALAHQSSLCPPSSQLFDSNLGCCSALFPYLSKAVASVTLQDKLSRPLQVAEHRQQRTPHENMLSNWELVGSALVEKKQQKKNKQTIILDSSSHMQIAQVCKQHNILIVDRGGRTSFSLAANRDAPCM